MWKTDRRKLYTVELFGSRYWNSAGVGRIGSRPGVFRPSTALRLALSPNYTRTHAMAQYVTKVTDALATDTYAARYVFATLDQHQLALSARVDWTFTPGLSLQMFAQPLLAAADFQDYKEFARPREFEFEVYGRDAGTIARDDATRTYTVDPDVAERRVVHLLDRIQQTPLRGARCCGGIIARARHCFGLAASRSAPVGRAS